eukprot:1684467-Amphidinium_carterae.1
MAVSMVLDRQQAGHSQVDQSDLAQVAVRRPWQLGKWHLGVVATGEAEAMPAPDRQASGPVRAMLAVADTRCG